jgi:hypothetical protein
MPRYAAHRGDVVALNHYKTKSLEEMVRRRVFGRRPNSTFNRPPRDLNATEVGCTMLGTNDQAFHSEPSACSEKSKVTVTWSLCRDAP